MYFTIQKTGDYVSIYGRSISREGPQTVFSPVKRTIEEGGVKISVCSSISRHPFKDHVLHQE